MIRLIKPYISFEEVEAEFREIFDSGMLTKGKYARRLPEVLCEYTGAKYAFNATSATTALAACLEILGIGAGDEVVVSDFSFPATVNVVEACGATPVFADVDRETYNMLPEQLSQKITAKTRAVIFVCALGSPDGLDAIGAICREKHIPLINDGACAIGSALNGKKIGGIADLCCFSFHPRKLLTSGEGGAITTSNEQYANALEIKLAHGATLRGDRLDFVTYGYNYRLPDLQCAMVIKQIEKLEGIVARRNETMEQYKARLEPAGYKAQRHGPRALHNRQSVVFTVPDKVSRDALIAHLKDSGIESTIGTYSLSQCTYYRDKYNDVQPNSLWLEQSTITLPCYDGVDVGEVCEAILAYK